MKLANCRSLPQTSTLRRRWQTAGSRSHATPTQARATTQVHAEVFRKGDAWVIAPPRNRRTKGVVHFLGGAFAGAAPQVLYSLLLDQLAAAGFTVVATPYAVTFKHLDCADVVRDRFMTTLKELRSDRATAFLAPPDAPVFGVGHSNGSLLHLLINSRHPGTTQGNAVISYNNKDVSAAIPIPGFLGAVSPAVAALRTANLSGLAGMDSASMLRTLSTLLPDVLKRDEAGQLSGAALALDQIGTVFGEVGDGTTDFTPSPLESRRLIQAGYNAMTSPVLLVRFADDTIDESQEMHSLLCATNSTGVSSVTLPGSHVTPCTPDVQWEVGPVFTPLDAVAALAKWQAQADVRRLGDTVAQYLDQLAQVAWSSAASDELAERQRAGSQQEAARRLVVTRAVSKQ